MRLWSIHPEYLDSKGLVALWREGLLAKKVLEGKTKGYTNHPQLTRFKNHNTPTKAINAYLSEIYRQSTLRGYIFDKAKITITKLPDQIPVTFDQIQFEYNHLLQKTKTRNKDTYNKLQQIKNIKAHPIFHIVSGKIEEWEKLQTWVAP